jgi:hypothetical protein
MGRAGRSAVVLAVLGAFVATTASAQSKQVVLEARPTKLGPTQNAFLTGGVASGRSGEELTLQTRECGLTTFRNVLQFRSAPGGRFQLEYSTGVRTDYRVLWKGAASAPVTVQQAPHLRLTQRSARRFEIGVGSRGHMWRKRVEIQQRVGSRWRALKTAFLTETFTSPGQSGVWTEGGFTLSVPEGSIVRAVLPAAQARPCYLPGSSNTVRTHG